METITISDDIYEKFVRIKGNKSFSAIIDESKKRNVEKRVEMLIKSAEKTGYEDELERKKGVPGEGMITSTVPAIANAIYDAVGVGCLGCR